MKQPRRYREVQLRVRAGDIMLLLFIAHTDAKRYAPGAERREMIRDATRRVADAMDFWEAHGRMAPFTPVRVGRMAEEQFSRRAPVKKAIRRKIKHVLSKKVVVLSEQLRQALLRGKGGRKR